jgi:alanine racemase
VTIRLTIRTAVWRSHVAQVANAVDEAGGGLVPVVKGNGYGFGRNWLATVAADFCDTVAVGTVYELDGLPDQLTAVVLTPTLSRPDAPASGSSGPVLTVGSQAHIDALAGWDGRVIVKLVSPMRRFGGDTTLVGLAERAGLQVVGVSIHPPLAGSPDDHAAAITDRLDDIDTSLPVWLSHLDPDRYRALPDTHQFRLRLGTLLWHGDKSALHLDADVLDVRPVSAGDTAGYRLGPVAVDGHLVMIGAGTANGVAMIDEGDRGSLSPFHFERTRLALHEPPHMHTSMAFVPMGDPLPAVGDHADLQRPLHMTAVDEYRWL